MFFVRAGNVPAMPKPVKRLPAEWEPQDAVLLAWPHEKTDWAPVLESAQETFRTIASVIQGYEKVIFVHPESYDIPTNDTWARDFGPITIEEDGQPVLLDFIFNGWGDKFPADLDNEITRELHSKRAFGNTPLRSIDYILEGGSIESDGAGTILTTTKCLLNPNRNPQFSKSQIEDRLREEFGAHTTLWLEHGELAGDDTDAHIDTLARFCPDKTIVYQACTDPADEHFEELKAMENELKAFADFRLLPLPWPSAKSDVEGHRLPATYANYLVINRAVLVPIYNDPADEAAMEVIQEAYPERDIVGIDCSTLLLQHGSLHCVTMQIPKGVL